MYNDLTNNRLCSDLWFSWFFCMIPVQFMYYDDTIYVRFQIVLNCGLAYVTTSCSQRHWIIFWLMTNRRLCLCTMQTQVIGWLSWIRRRPAAQRRQMKRPEIRKGRKMTLPYQVSIVLFLY